MITKEQIAHERALFGELGHALETLGRTTGLEGRVVALEPELEKGRRADAIIEINVDGRPNRYVVEIKENIDRLTAVGHIKAQLDHHPERGLLFAPYITPTIAQHCKELDLAFLDTAGNAYFKLPGAYVFITGEKPERHIAATALGTRGGGTPTALRVVFALLCNPELLNAPYRDIVDAAGVALGAVGWVFFDLKERGFITGGKRKHDRRFLETERLFDEWVTNYPIKLRPKLNPRRFKTDNPNWPQEPPIRTATAFHNLGAYWGAEVAAARYTDYLKPNTLTIYVKPERMRNTLPQLVANHRLRADPEGNVEILETFWNLPDNPAYPDHVPPILAYADLVATLDPRNLEAAKIIRERYIDNALRQL